jgi:hypothetical protein
MHPGGYYIVYLNLACVTIWNAMATSLRSYEEGLYLWGGSMTRARRFFTVDAHASSNIQPLVADVLSWGTWSHGQRDMGIGDLHQLHGLRQCLTVPPCCQAPLMLSSSHLVLGTHLQWKCMGFLAKLRSIKFQHACGTLQKKGRTRKSTSW